MASEPVWPKLNGDTTVSIETPPQDNGERPVVLDLPPISRPAAPLITEPPPTNKLPPPPALTLEPPHMIPPPPPDTQPPPPPETQLPPPPEKSSKKKIAYIIGTVIFFAIVGVSVALVFILSGNEGQGEADDSLFTTEGTTVVTLTDATTEPITEDPTITTTEEPATESPIDDPLPLDFEQLLDGSYSPRSFNGTWVSGAEILYPDENGSYVLYNVVTQQYEPVLTSVAEALNNASRVTASPDGSHLVIAYESTKVYTYSFLARYSLVELSTGTTVTVNPPGLTEASLQAVVVGPEGSSLAFAYENNVYYQDNSGSNPIQITTSGLTDVIFNGVPDCIYEYEVFKSPSAMWLTSTHLAYVTFDNTNVRIMRYPFYGEPSSVDHQYTQHHDLRYPKPGTVNPTVSVTLRNLNDGSFAVFDQPTTLGDAVIHKVEFASADTILIIWSNRIQNVVEYHLCSITNLCEVIFNNAVPQGWFINSEVIFNSAATSFVTILPQAVGTQTWKQVVQISQETTGQTWVAQARSNAAFSVEKLLSWTDNDVIWFEATLEGDATQQHLYSVSNGNTQASCITCSLPGSDGEPCLYAESTIDYDSTYIIVDCQGPAIPQTYILNMAGTIEMVWEQNDQLMSTLSTRRLPRVLRYSTQLHVGLDATDIMLFVPDGVENMTDVPLILNVHAAPERFVVTSKFNIEQMTYWVTKFNVVVAFVDGRGAGRRSLDNIFSVSRDLGTPEIDDQIAAVSFLQSTLPYLSTNRTCVFGFSFGGYDATRVLVRSGNMFNCGVAIAPIIDFMHFDSLRVEKLMDLPSVNPTGYNESSCLNQETVDALRTKSYFLIHGTNDEIVHYHQSMLLSRLLQLQDVYFHQMTYTDRDHILDGVAPHYTNAIEKFLVDELDLQEAT